MKKNILLLLVLILISYKIVFAQIKYYTATGRDSISYVATNQGLLILKRDSSQALQYYSLLNDSNKVYNRALDNKNYLILGTSSKVDLFSLSNKLLPNYIGSLKITNVISFRPFGDNFAIMRKGDENVEQYIIGSRNDSIKILDSIKSVGVTYTGRTAFYPEVVYPYFFSVGNNSSIVMYKYNDEKKIFEFIDTLNVAAPGNDLVEMFGAKDKLFILDRYTYSDHNVLQYYLTVNMYSTNSDTLQFLSQVLSYSTGVHLIDEIECTDSLIRYNSWYTYLNSGTTLNDPNNYFDYTISRPLGLSGDKIYHVSYDGSQLYYSTKIIDGTIHSAKFTYNPLSVNNFTKVKNFILYQNYPNPFNPKTTILYSIPKESLVIIKVYDALGKEIATLVNERKSRGNYSIDFNSSRLPSGIYFYRLISGTYISTKKMVILK